MKKELRVGKFGKLHVNAGAKVTYREHPGIKLGPIKLTLPLRVEGHRLFIMWPIHWVG